MKSLLIILLIVTGLAYLSQKQSMKYEHEDGRKHWDIFLIALIVFLVLFAGLRTYYNDTYNYIKSFESSVNIHDFLLNKENIELLNNPLFYGFQALVRTFTDNANVFFMICAIIVNILNVTFIKRNVDKEDFALSMFIYVALGTLMVSIAAQKQILAMSVLTLAITCLFKKKYVSFYIIVFIAGLIHSYAWMFVVLPLLNSKPWTFKTYAMLLFTFIFMNTFQTSIMKFLEVADEVGKNVAIEEVLDGNKMNIFRVLVYSIVPLIALLFKSRLNNDYNEKTQVFLQMSIISMLFMLMGTMNGANMFGRMGNYFEFGFICSLPWLIRQLFNEKSVKLVSMVLVISFIGFYFYDNSDFTAIYRYKTITQFISEVV